MNFSRRNNKMNVNRGVARAAPGVPVIPPPPPPFVRQLFYVPTIQAAKTCESEESTCNKSFPVLLLLTPFAGPKICSGPCSCSSFASKIE